MLFPIELMKKIEPKEFGKNFQFFSSRLVVLFLFLFQSRKRKKQKAKKKELFQIQETNIEYLI